MRAGFVGAGLIAWTHAIGLQAMIEAGIIDAGIAAVHDVDPSRAAGLAGATGAAPVSSVEEVMERCDAVWVCTPTVHHREAVEAAAARGRAVFCEKPLATDLIGAQALASAASRGGIAGQVGLVLRWSPVFRRLKALVASAELGWPMAVVFRDDQYFPVQGLYRSTWRSEAALTGGGCLIEHSIHDLDILRFCLGEVVEVSGRTARLSGRGDVEDVATVTLGFASGVTAQLTSVWHDILSRGSTRRVELFFQEGLVFLEDDFRGPIHLETSHGSQVIDCPSPQWVDDLPIEKGTLGLAVRLYVEQNRAFVEDVTAGQTPRPGFDEAVAAHRLVDAAYRSAERGGAPIVLGMPRLEAP